MTIEREIPHRLEGMCEEVLDKLEDFIIKANELTKDKNYNELMQLQIDALIEVIFYLFGKCMNCPSRMFCYRAFLTHMDLTPVKIMEGFYYLFHKCHEPFSIHVPAKYPKISKGDKKHETSKV